MSKEFRKNTLPTLVAAGIVAFILGQRHAGFMVAFVIFAMLIWIPYSTYKIIKNPEIAKLQLTHITIWLTAIALIIGIHYTLHQTTRHNADEIVATIKTYTTAHGHCPATLDEIGITRQQLKEKLGMAGYGCENGNPTFFYAATYIIYDTYHYNFEKNEWTYTD